MVPDAWQAVSAYVVPPLLGFLVLTGLAGVSLLRGRGGRTNVLFAAICLLGALLNADVALISLVSDERLALRIDRTIHLFFVFSIPVYIGFVHAFLAIRGRRWLETVSWLLGFAFLAIVPTDLYFDGFHSYPFGRIARAGALFHLFSATVGFTVSYCLVVLYRAMRETTDNLRRNRIRYIFWGLGFSALLLAFTILPVSGIPVYPLGNFSFVPAVFLAFGVLKYDLLDIGALVRRGSLYFLLTGVLTAILVLVIFLFHALFLPVGRDSPLLLSLLLALIVVFLFTPLRDRLQRLLDRLFFRGRYDYRELLREISGRLASLQTMTQVREGIVGSLRDGLQVGTVTLIVAEEDGFLLSDSRQRGRVTEAPRDETARLIARLKREDRPQSRPMLMEPRPDEPEGEGAVIGGLLDALDAVLVVPLPSRDGVAGAITLGQKRSGELFVEEDLELLVTVANQAATALENARSYRALAELNRDLERTVEKRTAALREALAERERAEQQLIRSESLAAIGQLVAGTAHELNNPIAGAMSLVESSVETIAGAELSAAQKEEILADLRFSIGELRRSATIIRSLLDLSRQTQVYVEQVNMNRAVDDALRVLHNQYKHLPVEIVKQYDEALPPVEGNFANLGCVLINIIRNALQALPDGRGRITLTTTATHTGTVAIVCRDSGVGIPEAMQIDIFKPFFTTKAVGRGTGLGLYLAHEIVRRHNGQIRVASAVGRGTVVTVELPCRRSER